MNWIVILGFIAISQGLYLIFTFWSLTFSIRTKIALSILVISHILLLLTTIFHVMDWYSLFPHFIYVRVPIPLLIGPSLYLLYKGVFPKEKSKGSRFLIHYIPFFIYLIIMMPYYVQTSTVKLSYPPINNIIWVNFTVIEYLKIAHLCVYLIWVFILNRNQKDTHKYHSFWSRYRSLFFFILIFYTIIVLLTLAHGILISYGFNMLYNIEFVTVILTILLVYVFAYAFIKYDSQWKKTCKKTSGKKSEIGKQVIFELNKIMEEQKVFRNSDLKISDVALLIGVSKQNLSEIINNELQTNFSKYLNTYRLKDLKSKLSDSKENHKTIIGLAYESGFNSKSSFQRIFKDSTGMTPKVYKKKYQ